MSNKKQIPNPNKLTSNELNFITEENKHHTIQQVYKTKKNKYKGRMISMSDQFYDELNEYLKNNPTEGNRSSFIVRIVAEYLREK